MAASEQVEALQGGGAGERRRRVLEPVLAQLQLRQACKAQLDVLAQDGVLGSCSACLLQARHCTGHTLDC